jgi:CHRD domain
MGVRKSVRIAACATVVAGVVGVGAAVTAGSGRNAFRERLSGFEEAPITLSTPGTGTFRARIDRSNAEIDYSLTFTGLESAVTQSHIHFGGPWEAGPVIVFLCTNLGNGPAGTQACPAGGGTITGTIAAADVLAGAAARGLDAADFAGLVQALRGGGTYVNVHSVNRGGGEIRAQIQGEALDN